MPSQESTATQRTATASQKSDAAETKAEAADPGNQKIKYMGSDDVRLILKGENFSGRLGEPVSQDVRWDWDNNHVVSVADSGLSPEAVELLLKEPDFKDVSDLKTIPVNDAQKMWRGMRDLDSNVQAINPSGVASSVPTSGSDGGGTTVGGSGGAGLGTGG